MPKHLVLVGAGHAHMMAMLQLADFVTRGHRVTVVSTAPFHYYSGMGPGLLSGLYRPEETRFHVARMVEDRGGTFVVGQVARVDPTRRRLTLDGGGAIDYDVASFNTGSDIPVDRLSGVHANAFPVKPIDRLHEAQLRVRALLDGGRPRLLVVGGGAAGVELAGNLRRLVDDHGGEAEITLATGQEILAPFPERFRRRARASLESRSVRILEGVSVTGLDGGTARLADGRTLPHDVAVLALGVRPSRVFADSGLPVGPDGGLLVDARLRSVAHPELFAGGDCLSFQPGPLAKVGVYAVRENPILLHNLLAALEGGEMRAFEPQQRFLLILNLGNGRGLLHWRGWIWEGRLAFRFKDAIDRAFMRRFQVSGELAGR